MAAQKREKYLGIPVKTWDKVELISLGFVVATTARTAFETVGKKGVFGFGKSSGLVKASRLGDEARHMERNHNTFNCSRVHAGCKVSN